MSIKVMAGCIALLGVMSCGGSSSSTLPPDDETTVGGGKADNPSSSSDTAAASIAAALDSLGKIDASTLSQNDQLLLELAKAKLMLAQQKLQESDPVQGLVRQLTAVQTLVGSFIAAPGDVFSRAPTLKSSATVTVSADLGALAAQIFGTSVPIGGTVTYSNATDVAAKYSAAKAQWIAVIGQLLVHETEVHPVVGAALAWGRSQYVISQPDCISIAGWGYGNQCE